MLIVIFICFMAIFIMVGIAFEEYCCRVAKDEGRLNDLNEDGGEDWGAYRTHLFSMLYRRGQGVEDLDILRLKARVRRGFDLLFILLFVFFAAFYFCESF
jgi:hypothetical protein